MKNFFIATTTLLTCLSISNSSYADLDLYAGLGGGLNIFTPKRKVVDTINPPASPITTKYNDDSGLGANLTIFAGVKEKFFNAYTLAGELSGSLSSTQAEAKIYKYAQLNNNAVSRITNKGNFTVSLLPGYYINQTTEGFLRLGLSRGRFEAKSSAQSGGDLIATGDTSRWLSGYVLGAGLETAITPCIKARAEYDYSKYRSFSQSSVLPDTINPNLDLIQSTVTPRNHAVTLSVVFYNFM